jgi:dipeptidyl aminopeptidase/acylaminoacyl peptidase
VTRPWDPLWIALGRGSCYSGGAVEGGGGGLECGRAHVQSPDSAPLCSHTATPFIPRRGDIIESVVGLLCVGAPMSRPSAVVAISFGILAASCRPLPLATLPATQRSATPSIAPHTPKPLPSPTPSPTEVRPPWSHLESAAPISPGGLFLFTLSGILRIELGCEVPAKQCIGRPINVSPLSQDYGYTDVSPNGRLLAITRVDSYPSGIDSTIRVIDWANGRVWTVAPQGSNFPSWSPDGKSIAYVDQHLRRICLANTEGPYRCLPQQGLFGIGPPAWSPDGTRLAFEAQGELYVLELAGAHATLLAHDAYDPSWSPTGRLIAFARSTSQGSQLYVYDSMACDQPADTCATLIPTTGDAISPEWSPDGTHIAIATVSSDGKHRLTVLDADCYQSPTSCSSSSILMTPADQNVGDFVWSPDGQLIAFAAEKASQSAVFIVRTDGAGTSLVTPIEAGFIPPLEWTVGGST